MLPVLLLGLVTQTLAVAVGVATTAQVVGPKDSSSSSSPPPEYGNGDGDAEEFQKPDVIEHTTPNTTEIYDVIIVGGGPSGLSAASGLVRVNRKIALFDSATYRNSATRKMHDLIGSDGLDPAYFRHTARQQILHYGTADMANGTVTDIQRSSKENNGKLLFTVTVELKLKGEGGKEETSKKTFTARRVVLATGLTDILPDIDGFDQAWGKGAYWCPWCDGHEHEGQRLGIMKQLPSAVKSAREVSTLNTDVVLLLDGSDTKENRDKLSDEFADWETYVEMRKTPMRNEKISKIVRLQSAPETNPHLPSSPELDRFEVHFIRPDGAKEDPPTEQVGALFVSTDARQQTKLAETMGLKLEDDRHVVDPDSKESSIKGVYSVGDTNNDGSTNIPHALQTGKRVAVKIHGDLAVDTGDVEIAEYKSEHPKRALDHEHFRSIWKRMNDDPNDITNAGESPF